MSTKGEQHPQSPLAMRPRDKLHMHASKKKKKQKKKRMADKRTCGVPAAGEKMFFLLQIPVHGIHLFTFHDNTSATAKLHKKANTPFACASYDKSGRSAATPISHNLMLPSPLEIKK